MAETKEHEAKNKDTGDRHRTEAKEDAKANHSEAKTREHMAKDQKGDEAEAKDKDKDTGIDYQDFGQAGNRAGDFKTKTDSDFHQGRRQERGPTRCKAGGTPGRPGR